MISKLSAQIIHITHNLGNEILYYGGNTNLLRFFFYIMYIDFFKCSTEVIFKNFMKYYLMTSLM